MSGWTVFVGRMDLSDLRSWSKRSALRRNSCQHFSRSSGISGASASSETGFYEGVLRLAWKRRDLAATFRWSRLLGGRRWGARKRDYWAMAAALPSRKAWQEWTKPGADGGMSATVLGSWSEWRRRVTLRFSSVRVRWWRPVAT